MRANEFINEAFDYQPYLAPLKRVIQDTFYEVTSDDDIDDVDVQLTEFFYRLQQHMDDKILRPLLKANPLNYKGTDIKSLTVSFKLLHDEDSVIGQPNMGALTAAAQRTMRDRYKGFDRGAAGEKNTAEYQKSNQDFTGEASYYVDPGAKSAIVEIQIYAAEVGSFLFVNTNTPLITSSLNTLTHNIVGKLFHELKHFMQDVKLSKAGMADKYVNKHYTGSPNASASAKKRSYEKTTPGYWLNSKEMDAWAANIASEISNIFGKDVAGMNNYMNAAAQGSTIVYNGVPVNTSMNSYHQLVFDKRNKMNTDPNTVWQKFIKMIYKDLQMHINAPKSKITQRVNTSQTQQAKPR
jgi:hypothetical protein